MAKKNRRSAHRSAGQTPHPSSTQATTQPGAGQPAKRYTPKSAQPKPQPKPKRGIAFIIAVAYVVLHGIIWSAALFATNRSAVDSNPIMFYLLLGASLADVAAGIGLWLWKQWGAYVFLASTLLTAALVTAISGMWAGIGALLPAIIVAYITLPKVEQAANASAA